MMESNQPGSDVEKKVKLSLADLPPGAKEGDSVSFTVASINQATGVAYVTAVASDTEPAAEAAPVESEDATDGEDAGEEKDTSVLLGPMDGLKNYLVKKSMDVPSNQGR